MAGHDLADSGFGDPIEPLKIIAPSIHVDHTSILADSRPAHHIPQRTNHTGDHEREKLSQQLHPSSHRLIAFLCQPFLWLEQS